MKKTILLLSLSAFFALSLTGCGSTGGPEDTIGGPIDPVVAESLAPTECPEAGPADDLAIAMGKEAVCDLGSVQFSLSLP